jgi:hypothetical protein
VVVGNREEGIDSRAISKVEETKFSDSTAFHFPSLGSRVKNRVILQDSKITPSSVRFPKQKLRQGFRCVGFTRVVLLGEGKRGKPDGAEKEGEQRCGFHLDSGFSSIPQHAQKRISTMVLVSKRTSLYATVSDNISCWLFWRVGNLPGKATLAGQEQLFGEGGSYESLATNTHSS